MFRGSRLVRENQQVLAEKTIQHPIEDAADREQDSVVEANSSHVEIAFAITQEAIDESRSESNAVDITSIVDDESGSLELGDEGPSSIAANVTDADVIGREEESKGRHVDEQPAARAKMLVEFREHRVIVFNVLEDIEGIDPVELPIRERSEIRVGDDVTR